jgi:hypothetical protein
VHTLCQSTETSGDRVGHSACDIAELRAHHRSDVGGVPQTLNAVMGAGATLGPCQTSPSTLLCISVRVSCRNSSTAGHSKGLITTCRTVAMAGRTSLNVTTLKDLNHR